MAVPHAVLKRLSRKQGQSIEKFLALSRRNDPFYVGTASHYRQARWVGWIYRLAGSPVPVHVRRLHYLAASRLDVNRPDGKPYTNSPRDWDLMHHACKYARYLGLIPFEAFEDRRNAQPVIFSRLTASNAQPARRWLNCVFSGLADRLAAELAAQQQPYYVEVWLEKSSVLDEVMPVAKKYMVNVVASLGEMSLTAVVALVQRVICSAKPVRIFYISDFDPAGRGMPLSVARKLEYLLRRYRRAQPAVKLYPLMLTPSQCLRYSLPRIPISPGNSRRARFESSHGPGATELDALAALHPGTISRSLSQALGVYCSQRLALQVRAEAQRTVRLLTRRLTQRIENWIPVLGTCTQLDQPLATDSRPSWLYDSTRDYFSQLAAYRSYLDPKVCSVAEDFDFSPAASAVALPPGSLEL